MQRRQTGYTLIEALIAILVMSIGLAGLGVFQVMTLQSTNNANNRAMAIIAAESMADQIRSNLRGYEFGQFSNQMTTATVADCSTGCNPSQMAQADVALWQLNLARMLPDGRGVICMDGSDGQINDGEPGAEACSGNGQNVIKIFWRETAAADGAGNNAEVNTWRSFGTPVYP